MIEQMTAEQVPLHVRAALGNYTLLGRMSTF